MKVLLANRQTRSVRRLASVSSGGYLQPDDVTGAWATWTRCSGFRNCRVVRLNLRNGERQFLPNPYARSQFASSVLRDGTVFHAESSNIATCNSRLRIFKKPVSKSRTRVQTLASGWSISVTSLRRVTSRSVDVFYDAVRCDSPRADIYRVRVAA